jgi:hypothetical protein
MDLKVFERKFFTIYWLKKQFPLHFEGGWGQPLKTYAGHAHDAYAADTTKPEHIYMVTLLCTFFEVKDPHQPLAHRESIFLIIGETQSVYRIL